LPYGSEKYFFFCEYFFGCSLEDYISVRDKNIKDMSESLMIVLIGVSGSGKSTLRDYACATIKSIKKMALRRI
jgi:adenylylsulfate kinase-like enzyme